MKTIMNSDSLFNIYKSLFDFNRDACYALDPEGNFLLFNQAAVGITGYTEQEALSIAFYPIIEDKALEKTIEHFISALKGYRDAFETSIIHKNGNRVDLAVVALPFYSGNELGGVVGMAKDITSQRNLETLLNGQNKILEMNIRDAAFSEVLDNIVTLIEKISDGGHCSILLADTEKKRLKNVYEAKKNGRNHFEFFHSVLERKNLQRLQIENEMRKALENHEFTLHYQPIMEISSMKVTSVEALIRWENPFLGAVSPGDFIPIAEETGFIIPVGEWVLRTACLQFHLWKQKGIDLASVSVNLSLRQFYQPDLISNITRILSETQISPRNLTIEITESMTMDVERAKDVLKQLKEIGVNISLDDFGTGYSSLSYLKQFPLII